MFIKDIDIEKREADAIKCKENFQMELNQRLEEYQYLASRNSIGNNLNEEEYMKSLRAAYEASSSDEEELAKRILEKKRNKVQTMNDRKSQPQYQKQMQHKNFRGNPDYFYRDQHYNQESDEEGFRARVSLPKQTKKDPPPYHKSHKEGQKIFKGDFQPTRKANQAGDFNLETSDEEQINIPEPRKNREVKSNTQKLDIEHLEDMNQEQLSIVKHLIDQRLREKNTAKPKKPGPKVKPEDPDVKLDDNFYDDKFLSLVYEMESQHDESYGNY